MARIAPVFRPSDYPGVPDEDTRNDLDALFACVAPGMAEPAIAADHVGIALAALSPGMALHLARLTTHLATRTGWAARKDLLELTIQAVNLHYASSVSFEARLAKAEPSGLGLERLAALPYWRTSTLFDAEQRLVLEYVAAVLAGTVPEPLFGRVREAFGPAGTIEFTTIVGCWSMWAMLINAAA